MSESKHAVRDDAPFETMLSRFGSRFTINPQVKEKAFRISPIGTYHWGKRHLRVAIETGGEAFDIPFGKRPFSQIRQSLRMTSIDYHAEDPASPLVCEVSFIAPFYPQDEDFCSVPAIYVLVWLHNRTNKTARARLVLEMDGEFRQLDTNNYSVKVYKDEFKGEAGSFTGEVAVGYLGPDFVDVPPGGEKIVWGILAGHVSEPVLDIKGAPYTFRYARRFKDVQAVLSYAVARREMDLRRNEVFESTVFDASLSAEAKELIAFGFQSFVANSWLATSDAGHEWFSVWEGNCGYHSTIDVEYNQAPFYLQYWPELLRTLFDEWAACKTDEGFMEHDMGLWGKVRKAEYGHPMKVEENTNFILMLMSYWRTTGDKGAVWKHYSLLKELAEFLFACDTTGNGFPNEGVENTLDSGSFVVELSKDQSYLAVKCITSYLMLAEAAKEFGDHEFAEALIQNAEKALGTLDNEAWTGDHYAVCLDQSVRGWNTYTMMVDNGLFYPLRAGLKLPFRYDRIIFNLVRGISETTRPESQRMTAIDNNGWFSQQMFRDMIAAHLGLDYTSSWADYLAYQKRVNREDSNCYKDAWPQGVATLNYYPRGLAASGLLQSAGGVTIDAVSKTVTASPPTLPVKLPLTVFADWKQGKIPWLEVDRDGKASVTGGVLPEGWSLEVNEAPDADELMSRPPEPSAAPEFHIFWGRGEVSGRHGYWSKEEMFDGKPFEVRVLFRTGKEAARDLSINVKAAKGIEVEWMDEEAFNVLGPGEMIQYAYQVRILPEYKWDEPALRATCFFRTADTNVTLPDKLLLFTRDPRKKFQQGDVKRQEAGIREE